MILGRGISIHALLAESDSALLAIHTKSRISIHALLAESDTPGKPTIKGKPAFLSTLSLRRATIRQTKI